MRPATTIKVRTEEPNLIFRTYSGQEQLSKEEIKAGEVEASQTVQMAVVGGILLYLSPFAVDFVRKFL